MWKLLKLTLLAAAVERGGYSAAGELVRVRSEAVALVDAAYGLPKNDDANRAMLIAFSGDLRAFSTGRS